MPCNVFLQPHAPIYWMTPSCPSNFSNAAESLLLTITSGRLCAQEPKTRSPPEGGDRCFHDDLFAKAPHSSQSPSLPTLYSKILAGKLPTTERRLFYNSQHFRSFPPKRPCRATLRRRCARRRCLPEDRRWRPICRSPRLLGRGVAGWLGNPYQRC